MSGLLLQAFDRLALAPGGVARLRELILSLAVRGKLVPQDPADEPASVLLQRIRAEKDRLIAEGKIRRDKPLLPITEEEKTFELPLGWEWAPLQHIGYTQTGTTPDKKNPEFYGTHIPFIKPGDIYPGYVQYDNEGLSERGLQDSGRIALKGSVLMVCIGTIGKTNIIDRTCSFNQQINSITPLCCAPEFVSLYLRCPDFQSQAWARSSSTTISILNKGKWEEIPVALPPTAEQARIVARVDELMRLCDALEAKGWLEAEQHSRLLDTLLGTLTDSATPEKLAANWQRVAEHFDLLLDRPEAVDALEQTILQLAVRGLLVPQDSRDESASVQLEHIETERAHLVAGGVIKRSKPIPVVSGEEQPFVLPRGWEWARLEQLSLAIVDCPHSTPKFVDSGILCIDTNSFKGGALLPHKLRYVDQATYRERIDRLEPAPGDLVFAREGSVGETVIIPPGTQACLGQRVMLFRFFRHVSNEFIRLTITTPLFLKGLLELHKGIGAKHVNVGDVRMAIVPVPPFAEQLRILSRVSDLRRLCADLRQRLAASQATQTRLAEVLVDQVA